MASSNMRKLGNRWEISQSYQHDQLSEDNYINALEACVLQRGKIFKFFLLLFLILFARTLESIDSNQELETQLKQIKRKNKRDQRKKPLEDAPIVSKKYPKTIYRPSLPHCVKYFQLMCKTFSLSGNFRDCKNTFQIVWKLSRCKGNFSDKLQNLLII